MNFWKQYIKGCLVVLVVGMVTAVLTSQQLQAKPEGGGTTCQVPTMEQTIQQALWDDDCDIVHILDGTHTLEMNLLIDRTVELRGSSPENVILDGDANDSVIVIYNNATDVVIHNLTIRNGNDFNGGAGIYNEDGTIRVQDVRIIENETSSGGAGFFNGGTAMLEQVELSNNTIVGISGFGGGLHNNAGATLNMINVTISNNDSEGGSAGVSNSGTINMTNVTVANNYAENGFAHSVGNYGTINFKNTIVTNPNFFNCDGTGTFNSLGHNLENGNSCSFNQNGDQINTNARLATLSSNGGLTYSHRIQAGSPAIDGGTNNGCPAVDQRGMIRPFDGDGDNTATCDIGAFEAEQPKIFLPFIRR